MKITAFLLFCGLMNLVAAPTWSQNTKVSLNMKDAPIEQVLSNIEDVSEFYFLFNQKLIDVERKVDVFANKKPIKDILSNIFGDNVQFVVYGRQIILTPKPKFGDNVKFAVYNRQIILTPKQESDSEVSEVLQQQKITGTVKDKNGTSLPGVNVFVTGTNIGVTTDIGGSYSIDLPSGTKSLTFSFIGMESQEIPIGSSNQINVTLLDSSVALGEVIVLGYLTRGKNEITGSTIQVSADELKQTPVTSIDQALQGKVAGLVINTTSGTPGSVQDLRIRGISSLSANNSPLIVIDGVPVIDGNATGGLEMSSLSSLAALSSNDIQSITVLKDASSTSAYGARGSNGVIVIQTIRGSQGKTKFSFSSSYGIQNKAIEGRKTLTAAQREELWLEGIINTYGVANGLTTPEQAYTYAQTSNLAGYGGGAGYAAWRAAGRPEGDWGNAVRNKNAPVFNVNLSASGGENGSSFYTGFGYTNNKSVVVGNLFEKFTGSLNVTRKMGGRVRFSSNNTLSYTNQDGIFWEMASFVNPNLVPYFMPPTAPVYNEDGTYNISSSLGSVYNTLYVQKNDVRWNHMTRGITNNFIEIDIIDNLKFKSLASFDFVLTHYKDYKNRIHGDGSNNNGSSMAGMFTTFNMVFQNSLDYTLKLNDHKIDFKALVEHQKQKAWWVRAYGTRFVADGLTNVVSAGGSLSYAGSQYDDWANVSYLGMANYNYREKYIADFTFRREGSSRFPADRRFGNFWSLGAAWNISKESFMSGLSFVDNLRIRTSYGVSGNSGIYLNSYQALLYYSYNYAGQGAVVPNVYGNPALTWEKNKNFDIGIDFDLFDRRLDGSFSYFNKTTFDLLQNVPLTMTSGFTSVTSNIGEMVNTGIEGILNVDVVKTSKFNLGLTANFATLKNEITELAKDAEGNYISPNAWNTTNTIEVGHTFNEWKLKEWAGVNPQTGMPQWYVDRSVDETLTENYNDAKRNYIGKGLIPTLTGGGGIKMEYMGVYLNANFYYAGGHMVFEDWTSYTWDNGLFSTQLFQGVEMLMDRWQKPGDKTDVPKIQHAARPQNAIGNSTRQLFPGDYMRLKDLVLGYKLPTSIISKLKLESATIYMRGTNLYTYVFDERLRKGFDPETGAGGVTTFATPPIKSLVFGINFNF